MRCTNCGSIINDSSLNCPYCGRATNEDYFGYRSADAAIRVQNETPKKKDNSGKIIICVICGVFAVFTVLLMLLMTSGSSNDSEQPQTYSCTVTVKQSFTFRVTDADNSGTYSVAVKNLADNSQYVQPFYLTSAEEKVMYFAEGEYEVVIMQSVSDSVTMKLVVDDSSSYSTLELKFDEKQLEMTNGN